MNQDQKKYLLKRIDEIQERKRDEIKTPKVDADTYLSKLKLIPNSKIIAAISKEIMSLSGFSNYQSIRIDPKKITTNWKTIDKEYDKAYEANGKEKQVRVNKLFDYCTFLKDKIVFGSESEALTELANLGKMKF